MIQKLRRLQLPFVCLLVACSSREQRTNPLIVNALGRPTLNCRSVSTRHVVRSIGPCAYDNSVVSVHPKRALSLLTFQENDLCLRISAVIPRSLAGGAIEFLPKFSSDSIAYIDGRGLVLFDIPKHKHSYFTLSNDFGVSISRWVVADTTDAVFILQLTKCHLKGKRESLKVIYFDDDTFFTRSTFDAGPSSVAYTPPWGYAHGTTHFFRPDSKMLVSRNLEFEVEDHALAKTFNDNRDRFRRPTQILVHPRLDMALVVETGKEPDWEAYDKALQTMDHAGFLEVRDTLIDQRRTLWLIAFGESSVKPGVVELITDTTSIFNTFTSNSLSNLEFSPDGKWLLVMDEKGRSGRYSGRTHRYFAFAVDTVWPYLSSEPVHLDYPPGRYGITSTAWVSNPLSFVAAAGDRLYKWELEGLHEKLVEEYRAGH